MKQNGLLERVVIVLGAGASLPLFPLGAELKRSITDHTPPLPFGLGPLEVATMQEKLRASRVPSIDALLSAQKALGRAGIYCMAYHLLKAEAKSKAALKSGSAPHNPFYEELKQQLTIGKTWDNLDLSFLTIITFNYERSLEYFLIVSLAAHYGKSHEDVIAKLAPMKVIHVYGSFGSLDPSRDDHLPYGLSDGRDDIDLIDHIASERIRVIPTARTDSPEFELAESALTAATTIGIFGFSFDPLNVRRLGGRKALTNSIPLTDHRFRPVYATCYGMTSAEAIRAADICGIATSSLVHGNPNSIESHGLPVNFLRVKADAMLRESLMLISPREVIRPNHLLAQHTTQ